MPFAVASWVSNFDIPAAWVTSKAEAVAQGDPLEGWILENLEAGNETEWLKKFEAAKKAAGF